MDSDHDSIDSIDKAIMEHIGGIRDSDRCPQEIIDLLDYPATFNQKDREVLFLPRNNLLQMNDLFYHHRSFLRFQRNSPNCLLTCAKTL
jgi:hypothetical protein